MDGFSVLKEIKSDRTIKHVPVIVLTNSIHIADKERSYALGAYGYAVKPFDVNLFNQHIATILEYWSKAIVLPAAPA